MAQKPNIDIGIQMEGKNTSCQHRVSLIFATIDNAKVSPMCLGLMLQKRCLHEDRYPAFKNDNN